MFEVAIEYDKRFTKPLRDPTSEGFQLEKNGVESEVFHHFTV